jgi:dTDP-4-dehydrorhamnose 3,5-epimerase
MKLIQTYFDEVKVIEPVTYPDDRGTFTEYLNSTLLELLKPAQLTVCLEYISSSKRDVLRGLHYQVNTTQGKLVTVLSGEIFDVVVDLRKSSKTFGQHRSVKLDGESKRLMWIPPGFAHGFYAVSEHSVMSYKCTAPYSPHNERCIKWDDNDLAIAWPKTEQLIVSQKDKKGVAFADADYLA